MKKVLLFFGPLYAITYVVANDVVAAAMYGGYSRVDQAISELSALGAPSAPFLRAMLPLFFLLVFGFGIGVWMSARQNRALRITGALLVAQALSWPLWLLFPMSARTEIAAGRGAANDIGHIALSALAIVFILAQMAFSAAALGKRFALFSIAMAVTCVISGAAVAQMSAAMAAGHATPWLGLVERVSYGSWLVWMGGLELRIGS